MELNLKRPLLFFDIESTGLNIPQASIIELSFVKILPGSEQRIKTWKIKPWDYEKQCQRPIEPEASEVNGVTDDMLTDCPTFYQCSDEIVEWLKDSDLAGYNSAKFDLPMLAEEFERVRMTGKKVDIDLHEPLMVDVQNIYHTMEPRNLKAAYRFYCGGADFDNAHTAEADTLATYEVLKGELDKYPDVLKNDVEALSKYVGRKYVDFAGQLILGPGGEVLVNFGKHKGKTLREVWTKDRGYFAWIDGGSFTLDTKAQFKRLAAQFEAESRRPASQEELDGLFAHFNGR